MQKIVITDPAGVGTIEWTPGPEIQEVLRLASPEVAEQAKEWMAHMIQGYLIALNSLQRTPSGVQKLQEATEGLISDTLTRMSPSADEAPPRLN